MSDEGYSSYSEDELPQEYGEDEVAELMKRVYIHARETPDEPFGDCPDWFDYEEALNIIATGMRKSHFGKLKASDTPIVVLYDAHIADGVTRFLIYLRTSALNDAGEMKCEFFELVELKPEHTATTLFNRLVKDLGEYGLTMEMLNKRVIGFEYEGSKVLDELAAVMKERLQSIMFVRPYMNSHLGRYIMSVFSSTRLMRLFTQLEKLLADDAARLHSSGRDLAERIDELTDDGFLEHEDWPIQTLSALTEVYSLAGPPLKEFISQFTPLFRVLVHLRQEIRSGLPEWPAWDKCNQSLALLASQPSIGDMSALDVVDILVEKLSLRFRF